MRIGLHIGPLRDFPPIEEFMDFVSRAEDMGFDPLLFSDTVSLSHFRILDPIPLMTLAAQATKTASVGTCVTNPLTRHLSVTANTFATVDHIAGGRTVLGIGSGDTALYLLGKKFVNLAGMRESLTVLRALLNGIPVTFEGQELRSNWVKPDLPIFLAADGPKMLALGGELADGLIVGAGLSEEVIDWVRARVSEGEIRAGRERGSTPIWVDGIVNFGPDREAVRVATRPRMCTRANHNFRVAYHAVPDEHLAGVRNFRENYNETDVGFRNQNAERVTDYLLDRFGIVGTEADVIGRFEAIADQGVETFLVAMPFILEERFRIIDVLAKEVIPRVG
jgi:alkanesulfonate monooxygenase SsuD/methylene tetrahydromethanopterin reductase-like flavin-dependent oxidoreductase (luciferase family)